MESARPCIALINDDTTFLDLMRDLLESIEGYEVIICKESSDAYAFVKDRRPDLVLLDIRMGGEERGWTILEILTLDPATRPIPVIVCSAAVRDLQAHQPHMEQFDIDVLPKPFDLDILLEKVKNGLARAPKKKV